MADSAPHEKVPLESTRTPRGAELAIISLIVGVCSLADCMWMLGIAAIILAVVALLRHTRRSFLAYGGILVGLVGISIHVWLAPSTGSVPDKRGQCRKHLVVIGRAIEAYRADKDGVSPPTLKHLTVGWVASKTLKCPLADKFGRRIDYFYFPPADPKEVQPVTIVACDFKDNHEADRNVLFYDGHVENMSEEDFQAALRLPYNAAFAVALRVAEWQ